MFRIDRDTINDPGTVPFEAWGRYRKTCLTDAVPFNAISDTEIETKEGEYMLPKGWQGYIAVDVDGDPYPIAKEVFEETYVEDA
jgi:hypothetical protein